LIDIKYGRLIIPQEACQAECLLAHEKLHKTVTAKRSQMPKILVHLTKNKMNIAFIYDLFKIY